MLTDGVEPWMELLAHETCDPDPGCCSPENVRNLFIRDLLQIYRPFQLLIKALELAMEQIGLDPCERAHEGWFCAAQYGNDTDKYCHPCYANLVVNRYRKIKSEEEKMWKHAIKMREFVDTPKSDSGRWSVQEIIDEIVCFGRSVEWVAQKTGMRVDHVQGILDDFLKEEP